MKRILSTVFVLCMIISILPLQAVTATEVDAETNTATLEKFGFAPDPSTYDTNALKPGKHIVDQRYDLYADFGNKVQKRQFSKRKNTGAGNTYYDYAIDGGTNYTNGKNDVFFTSTAFDPTGSRSDNYLARITLADNIWGGQLKLSVFDSEGKVVIDNYVTSGHISTSTQIHVWDLEGLIAIKAGDFDGDGKDELAIYTPNNYKETSSGSIHADIFVNIYKIDVNSKSVSNTQTIDLSSRSSAGEICEWEYTYKDGNKRYYCLPYVALSADDLNGDGIDDLMATISFSTYYRGTSYKTKYTTKQILDHNTYFASVLEAYEGSLGGKLNQTVKHKMLVTKKMGDYRYVLRNANAIVADVTADGSREIVIGGNYTRVTYRSTHSSTTANENRCVWIDENDAARNIIGFTTYEDLKNYNPSDENTAYQWTIRETGVAQLHYYEEDDGDPVSEPVSLCGYKPYGIGTSDDIFLEGQIFTYDSNNNNLVYSYSYVDGEDDSGITNIWLGGAVAANVGDDMFSREVLMFIYGYKKSGKDQYGWNLISHYGLYRRGFLGVDKIKGTQTTSLLGMTAGKSHVTLALVDNGKQSTYLEYAKGNTDVYFSDVEILAVMQAPPVYEELNDDSYIGNSGTSFTKSEGTSTGSSLGGSLTAGIVTGFEQETSFLGLFKCGGAEYELKVTGSVSYDDSTEISYDYSTGFGTSGTTDAVAVFTVPYVRYNCTMFMPGYTLPTEAQYTELCGFRDELKTHLEQCLKTGQTQDMGKYRLGCDYYEYAYNSNVDSSNYNNQLNVYKNVTEQINAIENSIASFGKGGTNTWGEVIAEAVVPYHYCVPQTPMVTTLDISAYDAIAECTPGLEKLSGRVFGVNYKAGDPSSYAHDTSELPVSSGLLTAKTNLDSSVDGFLTNSGGSSSATQKSQTISVEKGDSKTLGWGVALENTSVANVAGIKLGFTLSAEINGSSVWTTTSGNEYSGTVVDLPSGTPADYAYGWKLVAYNTKINNSEVPVVGYLTKLTTTPPPSIAQNISVENLTDTSATLTWENGERAADFYKILRVDEDGNNPVTIASNIVPVGGKCSYNISNLKPSGTTPSTSYYVIESHNSSGKKSIPSEIISVTTMPEGFAVVMSVEGIENVIYRDGKNLSAKLNIDGNQSYDTFYQWQVSDGNEWIDLDGKNAKTMNFKISTLDNNKKVRCAVTMFIGSRSYKIYSAPSTLHCTNSYNGYRVDWADDGKSVTITAEEGATPANIYLKAENANGISKIMYEPSSANGVTFNTSDVASDDMRIYIWENNLAPVTYPFVR